MAKKALEGVGTTLDVGATTLKYVTLGFPGVDNGDPIDNTTLDNTTWMTKQAQKLKEATSVSFSALLDPTDWDNFVSECGNEQLLSENFSGVGTLQFWGYLRNVEAEEGEKGSPWTITGEIIPTLMNASSVETAPVWTSS